VNPELEGLLISCAFVQVLYHKVICPVTKGSEDVGVNCTNYCGSVSILEESAQEHDYSPDCCEEAISVREFITEYVLLVDLTNDPPGITQLAHELIAPKFLLLNHELLEISFIFL
jgi:hypothetical protein